jgi:deoxyribonuclease-4
MSSNSSVRYLKTSQIEEAASYIAIYRLSYFTHCPYTINMCIPQRWHAQTLKLELEQTARLGGKGCVVHVGKAKGTLMKDALKAMESVLREVAPFASPRCRLLVETPAKQGSEVLTTVDELGLFFNSRFSDAILERLGICVDTAHVHGAGYNPLDYLQTLERLYPRVKVCLIHYNGSRVARGSCRDAHWPAGSPESFIPQDAIAGVLAWAAARGIPLVTE